MEADGLGEKKLCAPKSTSIGKHEENIQNSFVRFGLFGKNDDEKELESVANT